MFECHCGCVAQAVTKIQLRLVFGSFSKLLVRLTSDACLFDVERNDLNVEGVQEAIEGSGLSSVDHYASFSERGGADGEWSGVEEKVEDDSALGSPKQIAAMTEESTITGEDLCARRTGRQRHHRRPGLATIVRRRSGHAEHPP